MPPRRPKIPALPDDLASRGTPARLVGRQLHERLRQLPLASPDLREGIDAITNEISALRAIVADADRVLAGDLAAADRLRFVLGSGTSEPIGDLGDGLDGTRARMRDAEIDGMVRLMAGVGLAATGPDDANRMLGGLLGRLGPVAAAHLVDGVALLDLWDRGPVIAEILKKVGLPPPEDPPLSPVDRMDLLGTKPQMPGLHIPRLRCMIEGAQRAAAAAGSRPRYVISAMTPDDAGPGETAVLTGTNFGASGTVEVPRSMKSRAGSSNQDTVLHVTATQWTDTKITFVIPKGATPGPIALRIPDGTVRVCDMDFVVHRLGDPVAYHGGLIEVLQFAWTATTFVVGKNATMSWELSPSRHARAKFTGRKIPGPPATDLFAAQGASGSGHFFVENPWASTGTPPPSSAGGTSSGGSSSGSATTEVKAIGLVSTPPPIYAEFALHPDGPHGGGDPATIAHAFTYPSSTSPSPPVAQPPPPATATLTVTVGVDDVLVAGVAVNSTFEVAIIGVSNGPKPGERSQSVPANTGVASASFLVPKPTYGTSFSLTVDVRFRIISQSGNKLRDVSTPDITVPWAPGGTPHLKVRITGTGVDDWQARFV